mmetsp:Transcript_137409/g.342747  ORF Transcript_137409/g.342747 Transcript_137409/m.342747 type:complete len:256 (-) Transcript_137409:93-860(-)|eukprot:CAMPEP_0115313296 /NCGR_PEP_ID=MMETSP0270-20121206/76388_1 /TAXON_ID=71861 /ORGANISM="Scrippsiella trochoidea, Strain CCMP3099" /LENGTH=255 /DNA_ID=CAMNT_0002732375 /DNA_START=66 /DNA_END=833 /DNA_ORIENTATION=-
MVLPPWWIIHGVKPAGPDRDMGSWKAISFSPEQQEQFGINETGDVLDQPKFDAALVAFKSEQPAVASEPLFRILAHSGGGRGLEMQPSGELGLGSSTTMGKWKVYPGPDGWFRLSPAERSGGSLCLDLTNPGQQPTLAPQADVSGQYWNFEKVVGCKNLPGGAVARCIIGYKLHAMWTGPERVLTAGDALELKDDGEELGQVWEILDDKGELWMPGAPLSASAPETAEPELIACDFGAAEAVLIAEPAAEASLAP